MTLNKVNMEVNIEKIITPEIDYGLIFPKFRASDSSESELFIIYLNFYYNIYFEK